MCKRCQKGVDFPASARGALISGASPSAEEAEFIVRASRSSEVFFDVIRTHKMRNKGEVSTVCEPVGEISLCRFYFITTMRVAAMRQEMLYLWLKSCSAYMELRHTHTHTKLDQTHILLNGTFPHSDIICLPASHPN